ncbi:MULTISPECIES: hypothetical protein [Flavobacteriaceae]|uniref:TonB C-terminal domain-containing protein n=2 Tax=Flavobacteriaceae TaxID=49546 RepID=A0A4Y8APM0_9FLAO|nr:MULTISPECIES: hypothetical protein [Flavobacteriaceae]TEW72539.1 hypothetical protein E2488_13900 [Gramella jeungdoensis]GGK54899.1 hypothetical protein GCM10007963_24020 [Lutibacter litoralis]
MKKIKLLALALFIGSAGLFANNINTDDSVNDMRDEIVALINTPDFPIYQEITVKITFTFSSEGEIVVLDVDSKDLNILNYIRKNLNQKVIANPGKQFKKYTMPLTIK